MKPPKVVADRWFFECQCSKTNIALNVGSLLLETKSPWTLLQHSKNPYQPCSGFWECLSWNMILCRFVKHLETSDSNLSVVFIALWQDITGFMMAIYHQLYFHFKIWHLQKRIQPCQCQQISAIELKRLKLHIYTQLHLPLLYILPCSKHKNPSENFLNVPKF